MATYGPVVGTSTDTVLICICVCVCARCGQILSVRYFHIRASGSHQVLLFFFIAIKMKAEFKDGRGLSEGARSRGVARPYFMLLAHIL